VRAPKDEARFWTRFALAVLAGWRVAHLLSREDGPGQVLANLRARLGSSPAGDLMDCFQCLSVWVAAPLTLFVTRRPGEFVPTWLALSGAACWIERLGQEPVLIQPTTEQEQGGNAHGMLRPETIGAPRRFAVSDTEGTGQ
jgi:Protein of unknown function (DUF1360)